MIQEQSIAELSKKVVQWRKFQFSIQLYKIHITFVNSCLLQAVKVFCTDASRHVHFLST